MIDLDKLEQLAKAATPYMVGGKYTVKLTIEHKPSIDYISALYPDVVLELIAENKQLHKNVSHWMEECLKENKAKIQAKTDRLEMEVWGNDQLKHAESLRAQLAEAREVLEEYSGPNKMSETHGTLLNRFERWRTAARAYLEKYK